MQPKKNAAKAAATGSPDKAPASCRDALASSPSVSEHWSSPRWVEDGGASSANPAQTAGGKTARGKPAGRGKQAGVKGTDTNVRGAGRGTGAPLSTKRIFKAAHDNSPQSDQDFKDISRGRESSGTRRGLMQSVCRHARGRGAVCSGGCSCTCSR